ncbi:MAG: tetratricopeptide repeat protein, partial [Bradyrhizobium sp.]
SIGDRISGFRLALFLPVAFALIWLILRQTLLLIAAAGSGLQFPSLWPISGATVIAQSDVHALAATNGDAAVATRLGDALLDDPLASEPFYANALLRVRRGNHVAAIRMLEETRRREPRWVSPRLLLAQQYVVAGRVRQAVDEIAGLVQLGTGVTPQLIEALIPLSNDPSTRGAVLSALRRNPRLRQAFVAYVGAKGGDAGFLFNSLVAAPNKASLSDEQAAVVSMLVASGDYQRAYLAWINFLPASALSGIAFVYDGNFAGLPGPQPFNWKLSNSGSASAELTRKSSLPQGTALEASYFTEQPDTLAEQTLVLEPGSYVFSYSAVGSRDGDMGGALGWSIRCLGKAGTELLQSFLLPAQPRRLAARFIIPASDCPAQKISLVGTSGDVPATIHAEYSGLMVSRQSPPAATPSGQGTTP